MQSWWQNQNFSARDPSDSQCFSPSQCLSLISHSPQPAGLGAALPSPGSPTPLPWGSLYSPPACTTAHPMMLQLWAPWTWRARHIGLWLTGASSWAFQRWVEGRSCWVFHWHCLKSLRGRECSTNDLSIASLLLSACKTAIRLDCDWSGFSAPWDPLSSGRHRLVFLFEYWDCKYSQTQCNLRYLISLTFVLGGSKLFPPPHWSW